MKRGRPNIRNLIQQKILEALSSHQVPLTISHLRKIISRSMGREVSWNTVFKYTNEMVMVGKIQTIHLPHSKNKTKEGLTVYTLKK